jgi:hypothetical protein
MSCAASGVRVLPTTGSGSATLAVLEALLESGARITVAGDAVARAISALVSFDATDAVAPVLRQTISEAAAAAAGARWTISVARCVRNVI